MGQLVLDLNCTAVYCDDALSTPCEPGSRLRCLMSRLTVWWQTELCQLDNLKKTPESVPYSGGIDTRVLDFK